MAGLYDKIRKKKKENLEAIYKADQPKSMAEAVAKFKNVDSKAAYGGGEALADPAAAVQGGDAIKSKSKSKSEPCEEVDGVLMNTETGEPCVSPKDKLEDMTESRDDVNPDADEDGGGLFGRKKGGTKVGNFLRSVVGKKSYELMNASPFHNEKDNGEGDALENTEGGGGTSKGIVNIGGVQYDFKVKGGAQTFDIPTGGCPEGSVEQNGKCVTVTEIDPDAGNMPDDKWIKFCEENPCNAACNKQYGQCTQEPEKNQTCAEKYGPNFKEVNGKCVDITANAELQKKQEEVTNPAETSNNLTWGTQLLNNWGQNLLEGSQDRRDSKDIREDKRSFTKNEQDLYNEARKSLRKSGNLPGRGDQVSRQEAIYNEMNRLQEQKFKDDPANKDKEYIPEKTYGGQGFDVGGSKMSVGEIARDIRTGRLKYDSDDIQNLPYEVKEKIRDLSDNRGRTGESQYSEETSEMRDLKATGDDDYASEEEAKKALEEKKRKELEEQNSVAGKLFSPNKPANIKFGIGESIMKKKSGFSLKRGKLNRPGY